MEITFQNLFSLSLIGAALLAGLFILRFLFKLAWKIILVALVIISVILVAGYFLGFI